MTRGYIHSIHGTLTRAKKAIRKSMKTWEIYEVHPDHSFERVVSYKVMDETPVSVVGN